MSNYRKDRKPFQTDETSKQHKGFGKIDPANMGLDLPDWLDDSLTVSPLKNRQQGDEQAPAVPESQPHSVLEGMKTVCICKGIKKRIFWKAMAAGARTKDEINHATGSGSGSCQGRRCGPRILEMLRDKSHDGTTE